jgi:F-type H+-transporting ATPase subunit delta
MKDVRVSARYAKSLLVLSNEFNVLEKVYEEVVAVYNIINQNRNLETAIESPVIKPEKKNAILKALFENKVDRVFLEFMYMVVKKGRANLLESILYQFQKMYRELKNIIKAEITVAYQIEPTLLEKIVDLIIKKNNNAKVEYTQAIDNNLIGGFIVKYNDKLIDASVSTQISELRKHFLHKN